MSGPPSLPRPPTALPLLGLAPWAGDLWRVQNGAEIAPRTYPEPRYRFDAPGGEYPVLYACASPLRTLAEVYGDRGRQLGEHEGGRHLVRIAPLAPLPPVDLADVRTLTLLGLGRAHLGGGRLRDLSGVGTGPVAVVP